MPWSVIVLCKVLLRLPTPSMHCSRTFCSVLSLLSIFQLAHFRRRPAPRHVRIKLFQNNLQQVSLLNRNLFSPRTSVHISSHHFDSAVFRSPVARKRVLWSAFSCIAFIKNTMHQEFLKIQIVAYIIDHLFSFLSWGQYIMPRALFHLSWNNCFQR